jgi:hypothetical protein
LGDSFHAPLRQSQERPIRRRSRNGFGRISDGGVELRPALHITKRITAGRFKSSRIIVEFLWRIHFDKKRAMAS